MVSTIRVNIATKNATKNISKFMNALSVKNSEKKNVKNVAMVATRKEKKIHQIKRTLVYDS